MTIRLGVIADDFTGATDIAGFLVEAGLRTVQLNEPSSTESVSTVAQAEAVVISLKTRSIPPQEAVRKSLAAVEILQQLGAERVLFKYCSTFDSTSAGNIGPVTDALMEALGTGFTVVVPALPVNGRTVYQGNLFVHHQPLHESGMRDHPVTPMRDSNLMRLMEAQSSGTAVSIPYSIVDAGPQTLGRALEQAEESGARYAVLDTLDHEHLETIGLATAHLSLTTGGSGLGHGIARALGRTGDSDGGGDGDVGREAGHEPARHKSPTAHWRFTSGAAVILSGSCSQMTNRQVDQYLAGAPGAALDVGRVLEEPGTYLQEVLSWVVEHQGLADAPIVYATAPPETVQLWQERFGAARVSEAIESFFGELASGLRDRGTTRFIAAGGETSGAVTQALGISGFDVGPAIAPGVPWTRGIEDDIDLALKSGNFGDEDFFTAALTLTGSGQAPDATPQEGTVS